MSTAALASSNDAADESRGDVDLLLAHIKLVEANWALAATHSCNQAKMSIMLLSNATQKIANPRDRTGLSDEFDFAINQADSLCAVSAAVWRKTVFFGDNAIDACRQVSSIVPEVVRIYRGQAFSSQTPSTYEQRRLEQAHQLGLDCNKKLGSIIASASEEVAAHNTRYSP